VWLLAAVRAGNTMGLSLVMAFMAIYLNRERGVSGTSVGLLGTAQMLGVAVGPVIGGAAFDAWQDRPVAMWGALAACPLLLAAGYAVLGRLRRRDALRH